MNALIFDRELEFRADYPEPQPAPGESIVQVSLAGICGTDLEISRGYMGYHGVPGHEFVGRVADTADPKLRGRRVVGEINAACGHCENCIAGLARHCPKRTVLGILGRDGAFAEYLRLPDENLIPVPDSIPDEAAVFVEPLAAAYEILEQVHFARNHRVAVLGDGRLGAMVALVLQSEKYRPLVFGHHAEKLKRLAELGLATSIESSMHDRFDTVVDCTGHGAGLSRAIEMVKPRGTIILKSTVAQGAAVNLAPVVVNEITVVGSRCGRFRPALDALASKTIDPTPLLDGIFALQEGLAAFRAAENTLSFKIVLKPETRVPDVTVR